MLESFRKRKDNLVSTFIILAVVAVMALYGVGQMNSDPTGGGVAAWVNGESISHTEYAQALERQTYQIRSMFGGQIDERMLNQFQIPRRTLNELIQYKLISQQARKMGIVVTDYELATFIRSLPYLQKDGKFDSEAYNKIPNRGAEEKIQRERLQAARFQEYLDGRVRATPAQLERAHVLQDTKVNLDYAKIDLRALGKNQKPNKAAVDEFLKKTPEKDLETYYAENRADFTEPGKVQLKQIRVGIPFQASPAQKEQARAKIDEIAKGLTAANFSERARQKSDDEYAKKGGEVGWLNRGTLEKALESAIDGLDEGQISAPIETTFGYFLVLVEKKKEEVVKPFKEVKTTIAERLLAEKQGDEFVEKKKKEWNDILASGKSLEPELKAAKIELKKTGPFSVGQGSIPNVGQGDELVSAVFELTKAKPAVKGLIPSGEQFYYFKLASLEPAKPADFSKSTDVTEKSFVPPLRQEILSTWLASVEKNASIKTEVKFEEEPTTMVQ